MKAAYGMCQWAPTVVSALQYRYKAVVWLLPFIYRFQTMFIVEYLLGVGEPRESLKMES